MRVIRKADKIVLEGLIPTPLHLRLSQLEGRRRWETGQLTLDYTAHNWGIVTAYAKEIITQALRHPSRMFSAANGYQSRTKAYPHQERALEAMRAQPTFGLFMEQGTGKTKVIIDRSGELYLNGAITGVLVVTKKRVHQQWAEEEFPKHCGVPFHATYWGAKVDKRKPPRFKFELPCLMVFCINYDAIKFKKGADAVAEFCRVHSGRLLIAADESQEIKDASTGRWKALEAIKHHAPHRVIATGTPIAKDLTDEWAQLKWLNEDIIGIRYKTTFQREYCIMGGFEGRVVVGHRNIDRFKSLSAPYIFRATKEEIGLLPKAYERWRFDLTAGQLSLIQALKEQLLIAFEDGQELSAQSGPHILGKIQQVANGFLYDDEGGSRHIVPVADNPRINAAFEWYEANDGKAIIWARFREDIRMLMMAAKARGVNAVAFGGETPHAERSQAIELWLRNPDCGLLIASQAAAGTGLNLQVGGCRRALYFSNSFKAIDRWQSEDRIHRIGTNGICNFTDLVARRSCDTYILGNIRKKKSLSNLVLDDIRELIGSMEDDEYDNQTDNEAAPLTTALEPDNLYYSGE